MNKLRVASLLASGLSSESVASIVGVSPARISQLRNEEDFKLLLLQEQTKMDEKDVEEVALSAKYLTAEHMAIDQIMNQLPVSELRDSIAALKVISQRQIEIRKAAQPVHQSHGVINNFVTLQLPNHIVHQANSIPEMQITAQQEIISVGNRNLAPLSSSGVTALFRQMNSQSTKTLGEQHDTTSTASSQSSRSQEDVSSPSPDMGSFLNSSIEFASL